MKTQMRFQKILMILSLVVAALGVVYALIFNSGLITQMYQLVASREVTRLGYDEAINAVHDKAQAFSDTFLILGIVFIIIMVLPFIVGNHSRRNYYIENYVVTGIVILFSLVFAILLLVNVVGVAQSLAETEYQTWNFISVSYGDCETLGDLYTIGYPTIAAKFGEWSESTWNFTLGYVLFGIVLVDAALNALNLVWKINLMRGEKELLRASQAIKEAA